jgi:hypothetical protein
MAASTTLARIRLNNAGALVNRVELSYGHG